MSASTEHRLQAEAAVEAAALQAQLRTPPLDATADPSPAYETIISPALEDADKPFDLDAPVAAKTSDAWRMPECWGHRGVGNIPTH